MNSATTRQEVIPSIVAPVPAPSMGAMAPSRELQKYRDAMQPYEDQVIQAFAHLREQFGVAGVYSFGCCFDAFAPAIGQRMNVGKPLAFPDEMILDPGVYQVMSITVGAGGEHIMRVKEICADESKTREGRFCISYMGGPSLTAAVVDWRHVTKASEQPPTID